LQKVINYVSVALYRHLCAPLELQVRDWYVESFSDLKKIPPIKDTSDEEKFTELLRKIYQRHAHVVPTMARSVYLDCFHRSVEQQSTRACTPA
jgi:hypothetical protein